MVTQVNHEKQQIADVALADRRFVVVVTSHSGRVIRQQPQPTIGKAKREARRFAAKDWVARAEVVVEEERA